MTAMTKKELISTVKNSTIVALSNTLHLTI